VIPVSRSFSVKDRFHNHLILLSPSSLPIADALPICNASRNRGLQVLKDHGRELQQVLCSC
jgi:hypothetical protein